MIKQIKWMLFDFGGCLDSDGVHSRILFFNQFLKSKLIKSSDQYQRFQDAYTYSDQMVINNSLITKSKLLEMNQKMCYYIAKNLDITEVNEVSNVAMKITEIQSLYLNRNKQILNKLKDQFHLGLVSNFSGNLTIILNEFCLTSSFNFVLDSYHLGISKPNPDIFKLAILKCETDPKYICFVGDNRERDIIPAKRLGMKTILINSIPNNVDADYTFASIEEILVLAQTI